MIVGCCLSLRERFARDLPLNSNESRDWRPFILLAVLLSHIVVLDFIMRVAKLVIAPPGGSEQPLILMFLPHREAARDTASKPRASGSATTRPPSRAPMPQASSPPADAAAAQPWIDWEHEAELAAQNGVAAVEKEKGYRNLSGLSPDQLAWIRRNHMEPAPPGIPWGHPRVEYSKDGLPIIWINDHCVVVPIMMFMMFCQIGHIEANGDLFKHMHDPGQP